MIDFLEMNINREIMRQIKQKSQTIFKAQRENDTICHHLHEIILDLAMADLTHVFRLRPTV